MIFSDSGLSVSHINAVFFFLIFFLHQLRDYRIELDTSLPAPLDAVARWLLKTEGALGEEETEPQDHGRAADDAKEKQEVLRVSLVVSKNAGGGYSVLFTET